ncbi:hypothetical protein [Streptomyces brevispora]|uniref:hypothetical protein n=1 Tax=Streptomyces brevispora TaxID=887462 RepID=UPI0038112AB4
MLSVDVYGDATEEEIRALGYDPDNKWDAPSTWEFGNKLSEYRKRVAKEKEEALWTIPAIQQPAEEGPVVLSEEELAEVYAQMDAERAEKAPAAIGRNGLVLINDPDRIDMTDKNWDYVSVVLSQTKEVLSPVDKTILTVVAKHCGINSHGCSVAVENLSEELGGMDIRNFKAKVSDLTEKGWLTVVGELPPAPGKRNGTKIRHITVPTARQGKV